MSASAAPVERVAERSTARVRAGLVTYGFVLALFAMSWWSGGIATSQVHLQGSRQTLLANSISVLDQGGPPLLASSAPYKQGLKQPSNFFPANEGDDEGIYLYLPVAGHVLGDRDPLSLEKWFAIGAMALVPLLYPLLFFTIFESLAVALVVPLVAVVAVRGLINTDIYWVTVWILLLGLPLVYAAIERRTKPKLSVALLAGAAVLASFATSVRVNSGLGVALVALVAALVIARGWRWRIAAGALIAFAYLSIATIAFAGVRAYRDHVSHMPASTLPNAHPIWHATYLGLGYLPNRWGIRWDDAFGFQAAQRVDPKVVLLSPHYEHIIRHLYFTAVKADPGWAAHLYLVKLAMLARAGAHHYWLALVLVPILLAIGPASRRLRYQLLLLLPCVLLTMIPPLLTQPLGYDQGFLGGLLLLSLLVLAAVIADAEPVARELPSGSLGRLIDGQPAAATITEIRALLSRHVVQIRRSQTSAALGGVVAVVTIIVVAAGWAATALASANDDTAFFYAKATPGAAVPTGGHVVDTWNGASFPGWSTLNGATSTVGNDGIAIQTASALVTPQFESPAVPLHAGRYAFVVSGAVEKGGILVQVVEPDTGTSLATGYYWHGQAGLGQPGMVDTFTLPKAASVQVALEDWARVIEPSTWTVNRVTLVRLPPAAPTG